VNITPRAVPQHWAAAYIGKPWALGAEGPDAYDCWGLIAHVQRHRYGRDVPRLQICAAQPSPEQWHTLDDLMRSGKWRRVDIARDGDVMQMIGARGPHVGVVVQADGRLGLLHAVGMRRADGSDEGTVLFTPLAALGTLGYGHTSTWRAADAA
jgi:hypothetical protein